MSYEVIIYFEDLQDDGHPYNVGDVYPRKGLEVSEERILELSTSKNKRNKPLIRATSYKETSQPEEKPVEPVKEPEAEEPEAPKKVAKNGRSNSIKPVKGGSGKKK